MTQAGRLLPSSPRLLNWGMILNGVCITAQISESRSSAGGCTLSQVLEDEVPDGYFLSPAAMRKILNNLSPDRKAAESKSQTSRCSQSQRRIGTAYGTKAEYANSCRLNAGACKALPMSNSIRHKQQVLRRTAL